MTMMLMTTKTNVNNDDMMTTTNPAASFSLPSLSLPFLLPWWPSCPLPPLIPCTRMPIASTVICPPLPCDFVLQKLLKFGVVFRDLIGPFKRALASVKKPKCLSLLLLCPDCIYAFDHSVWHGEGCEQPAFQYSFRLKAEELVTALQIVDPCQLPHVCGLP